MKKFLVLIQSHELLKTKNKLQEAIQKALLKQDRKVVYYNDAAAYLMVLYHDVLTLNKQFPRCTPEKLYMYKPDANSDKSDIVVITDGTSGHCFFKMKLYYFEEHGQLSSAPKQKENFELIK